MAKKKLTEKIADAVDHVLHPDQPTADQNSGPKNEPEVEIEQPKQLSQDERLAMHPKFAKFKPTGENHQ